MNDIDDAEILDDTIRALRSRIDSAQDTATWIKLNDRLLKALAMKAKSRTRKKGKGFDLEPTRQ